MVTSLGGKKCPGDTRDGGYLIGNILSIFNVQFMESLNVVTGEGDGHQDHVLPATLHQTCNGTDSKPWNSYQKIENIYKAVHFNKF